MQHTINNQGKVTRRGRLAAKLSAGVLVAAVAIGGLAGTAGAANYDGRSRTASGAAASFSALCGGSSGRLTNSFGFLAPVPNYWRFTQRQVGGTWSNWTSWTPTVNGIGRSVPIVLRGNWQFVAEIAYWNGRAWEYDAEMVTTANFNPYSQRYVTSSSCRIG